MAVIDLGPDDGGTSRKALTASAAAGGFELLRGDGIEDALAGVNVDADALQLGAALASAQTAYGALDCVKTLAAARGVRGIAAARQAASLAVPELPRVLTYLLLCADRLGDADAAQVAAGHLRSLGATPPEVAADVWRKYPEVDTVIDRELVQVTIGADVVGAAVYVDFRQVGVAPVMVTLTATEHVVAVASGSRRGWAIGTAVKSQPQLVVPTTEHAARWSDVAARVALWSGTRPSAAELGWVLARVNARLALVRAGRGVEIWGRATAAELPRLLGGDDGESTIDEADRLVTLAQERVTAWTTNGSDPDRPLITDDPNRRGAVPFRRATADTPTKWWVYATVLGAALVGGTVILYERAGTDRQRIEVRVP